MPKPQRKPATITVGGKQHRLAVLRLIEVEGRALYQLMLEDDRAEVREGDRFYTAYVDESMARDHRRN